MEAIPQAEEWAALSMQRAGEFSSDAGLDEARGKWDQMAPAYARKRERSGYLAQLTALLNLQPGETLLDMGCGPGVLSIPQAKSGHSVVAVDFSDGMLEQLRLAAADAGTEDRFQIFRRAWQENWDGIPMADVAVSSRSMTTHDIADAVRKLESKARNRVVVTTAAGETPWFDARLRAALGRTVDQLDLSAELICLVNYLFATGRFPEVRYIECPRAMQSDSREELRSFLFKAADVTPEEEPAFNAYFEAHVTSRPGGGYMLDYQQNVRWAYVCWHV